MTAPLTQKLDARSTRRGSTFERFIRRPAGAISLGVLVLVVFVAVFAQWLAPYDPNLVDLAITRAAPSPEHWLGGDTTGRDVLSRLIWGAQITLWGALVAIATSLVLGVPSGLAAGYFGGVTDRIGMWISDGIQSIPGMIILLIVGANTGNNFDLLMITVGVFMAPGYFRLTRSTVLAVRNEPYIDAAKVAGLTNTRIIARHIVRQVRAPIVIQSALTAGIAMGMQAGLQFLGIGGGTTPGWGAAMNEGFRAMRSDPLLLLWPSLALGITIAALAVLGSTLADVVSVKSPIRVRRRTRRNETRRGAKPVVSADTTATGSVAHAPTDSAVQIENLRVRYETPAGDAAVVHGITLDVAPGEVLGIVGASGSGKSQTVFAILDLLPAGGSYDADALWIGGKDVTALSKRDRHRLLGHELGYVPQEPMTNLDPSYTIGYQLTEPLRAVHGMSRTEAKARAIEVLDRVGVDPVRVMKSYPHEVSGGMAQRVLIAGAISGKPSVLVADEPTTALDVTVQAEVLELLRELQQEYRMALVIVTHNFGVVADICDRVVVMRSGDIIEIGDVERVFDDPSSEYTRELIAASLDASEGRSTLDEQFDATAAESSGGPDTVGGAAEKEVRA